MKRFATAALAIAILCGIGTPAMAGPLSQKGFFPTANFTSAWQSYLPSGVPIEKINLYTSDSYVMQPGFQLAVDVQAEIVKTESGFHYSYTLKNTPESLQSIAVFGITREAPITAHSGGAIFDAMSARNPYGNAIGWYPTSAGVSKTRTLEMLLNNSRVQIPIEESGVFPGMTASGMAFDSDFLPGIVTAFCRGKGWLINVSQGAFITAPVNEHVSGKTLGPVLVAQSMDSSEFAKYIQRLVAESVSLGWLSGEVALTSAVMAKNLAGAGATEAPKMTYKEFHDYLNGFWFGTAEMTAEARTLLSLNLAYGMQRFGE